MGDFFAKPTEREMCFLGGGAGMAPLRSHIRHQLLAPEYQTTDYLLVRRPLPTGNVL